MNNYLIPRPLIPGDKIAVAAPSGWTAPERVARGLAALKGMGFEAKLFFDPAAPSHGYFSAPDAVRLKYLQAAMDDEECAGIWPVRGGYGLSRIVDRLDFYSLKKRPKFCVGLSDLSLFAQRLHKETGLPFYYGPMIGALGDDEKPEMESLRHWLKTPNSPYEILPAQFRWLDAPPASPVTGKLVGGCLSLLTAALATPADLDWEDAILFIEDLNEPIFRLDRMLTQLREAGEFKSLRGVICGHFLNLTQPEHSLSFETMLRELFGPLKIPVALELNCGHAPGTMTIPLYRPCRMEMDGIIFAA